MYSCGRKRWKQPQRWNDEVEKAWTNIKKLALEKKANDKKEYYTHSELVLLRQTKNEKVNKFQTTANEATSVIRNSVRDWQL